MRAASAVTLAMAALVALLCVSFPSSAVGQKKAILGIDIGDAYMKVAVIQHGRLPDIVTNTASKRKTETAVGFDNNGHRRFAGDAVNAKTRTPLQVYSHLPGLLGVSADHPVAKAAVSTFMASHNVTVDPERGTVLFTHPKPAVDGTVMNLGPEELTGMLLGYAKAIGEEFAAEGGERGTITDCVLTVPSFFTQRQRQALLDAARIADLKVLSLVDANTAAAVQYGLDRKEDKTILIFNMGAESAQASLVHFTTQPVDGRNVTTFNVVAKAWENLVGGSYLSAKVRDEFAKEYNEQRRVKTPDYDAFTRPRAMERLDKAADKTKQVLSANKASPPVFVSSVDNDVDFKGGKWERERLEELAGDFFDRALLPVDRVLRDAGNLTLADIDFVEIIGGGLRVPKMQELLRKRFNSDAGPDSGEPSVEIGVHLNGDEAVALGAVFVAANRSRSFRVRHVGMTDVLPFQINVELNDIVDADADVNADAGEVEVWSKDTTLAQAHRPFKTKTVSFVHTKDIELELTYVNNEAAGSRIPEGTPKSIAKYSVTGVVDAVQDSRYTELGDPKIKLTFEVNRFGLIQLAKAHAEFQETVVEQVEERVPVNKTDEAATEVEDAADAQSTDGNDDAASSDETAADETDGKDNESDSSDDAEKAADSKSKKKKKKAQEYTTILVDRERVIKHKVPLKIDVHIPEEGPLNLNSEQFAASRDLYTRLQREEKAARDLENARNALETYLYSARDILSDTKGIEKVLTDDDRDELKDSIMDSLDWLEDEDTGLHASIHQVRARKSETKDSIDAVLFRLTELELRPKAVAAARAVLAATEAKIAEWAVTKPQLTDDEFSTLREKLAAVAEFLEESEAKQADLTDFVAPAFTSEEVAKQLKPVQTFVERLMKKPAPVPTEEETEADANQDGDEEESTESADDEDAEATEATEATEETDDESDSDAQDNEDEGTDDDDDDNSGDDDDDHEHEDL